jgi:hypothetical protein
LVKNSNDPDVARYVLANLTNNPSANSECVGVEKVDEATISTIRIEAMRSLVQLSFLNQVPAQQAPLAYRYIQMSKFPAPHQTQDQWTRILTQQQQGALQLHKKLLQEQLLYFVKQQQKQQQELASTWRDLMKLENEMLIRKMNDPNPLVALLATQAAGKRRLPVEKKAIGLLSQEDPMIRQAARQTLIRLGYGIDYGPDPTATPPQIAAAVRSWNEWLDVQTKAGEQDDTTPVRLYSQ